MFTLHIAWLLYTPQGIILIMMRATIQLVFNQKIKRFLFTQLCVHKSMFTLCIVLVFPKFHGAFYFICNTTILII